MTINLAKNLLPNSYKLLIFIGISGLLLRVWGIHFGLPHLYGPAEHYTVNNALSFGRGSIVPLSSAYPPLYAYFLSLLYGIYFLIGYLFGSFHTVNEFALSYYIDPSPFYLIGRAATAIIGTGTILLVYLLGSSAFDSKTALAGSVLLATTFLHVKYSHYIRPDIPMTFLMVFTILLLFYYLEKRGARYLYVGGFVAGLAVSTKYTALLLVFPIFVAHLFYIIHEDRGETRYYLKAFILSYLFMGLGFIAGSPYILFDFSSFWSGFSFMVFGFNRWDVSFFEEVYKYGAFLFSEEGLGIVLGVASVSGLFVVILSGKPKKGIFFLSFPAIYFVMMSRSRALLWYIIPLLPFLCLLAARFITFLFDRKILASKAQNVLTLATVLFLMINPLNRVIRFDFWISQKDTRTIAKEWIEENIPESVKLLVDNYGPPLEENRESLFRRWKENRQSSFEETFRKSQDLKNTRRRHHEYILKALSHYNGKKYNMVRMTHAYWKRRENNPDLEVQKKARKTETSPLSTQYYEENGFDYFITASYMYERYFTPEGRKNFPASFEFYNAVGKKWNLIKVFDPHPLKRPGPVIKIFKLRGV